MKRIYLNVFFSIMSAVLLSNSSVRASDTDDRIQSSAKDSYVYRTYLKDDAIKTVSNDGVVTLTGTVKEESHKALAQETVANLPGVKSVDNQLTIIICFNIIGILWITIHNEMNYFFISKCIHDVIQSANES